MSNVNFKVSRYVEKNAKDVIFLSGMIHYPESLMYYLSVEGCRGDVTPFAYCDEDHEKFNNKRCRNSAGIAVHTEDDVVYFQFDKSDWRRYWDLRNKILNENLFCGKE